MTDLFLDPVAIGHGGSQLFWHGGHELEDTWGTWGTTERRNDGTTGRGHHVILTSFRPYRLHELSNAAEVGRGVELEGIAVAAPELDEGLGRQRGLEQPAAVCQGHHIIGPGVKEKLWDADPGDLVDRGKAAASDPSNRDIRIELGAPLDDRGERTL